MRFLTIATATALLLLAASQTKAGEVAKPLAQVATTEYSADATKKPMKKAHKKAHHKKKEKVEYMKAAPMK